MIVHELEVDQLDGFAKVLMELTGHERLSVLRAVRAPLSSEWSCKVFVTLEYEALTDEARKNILMGESTDDDLSLLSQLDVFTEDSFGDTK